MVNLYLSDGCPHLGQWNCYTRFKPPTMQNNMKPILLIILAAAFSILLFSCGNEKNEDITNEVNKQGSVETSVHVEHLDSLHDILITRHRIWAKFNEVKTLEYRDTIPGLGMGYENAENSNGDTQPVRLKKDYEIFITVK
jgi:hypothetical protein